LLRNSEQSDVDPRRRSESSPGRSMASSPARSRSTRALAPSLARGLVDGGRPRRRRRGSPQSPLGGGAVGNPKPDAGERRDHRPAPVPAAEDRRVSGRSPGRRDHDRGGHPRHQPRPHAPRPRRGPPAPAARTRPQRGGDPPPREPASPRCLVARHRNSRGITALKRALEEQREIGETITKSAFEERFRAFLAEHALPHPRMNAALGPYEPGAFRPEQRLVVELDSYGIHTARQAFEADRERDRARCRRTTTASSASRGVPAPRRAARGRRAPAHAAHCGSTSTLKLTPRELRFAATACTAASIAVTAAAR
jgi:hypothetical protein